MLATATTLAVVGTSSEAAAIPAAVAPSVPAAAAQPGADWDRHAFRGEVQVVRRGKHGRGPAPRGANKVLRGVVFDDRDRDSRHDHRERGLAGVTVSNGRDVVATDRRGRYALPAYDNMTVFVTQPAGWQAPVDDANVVQFAYHHLPQGSPELRYGGLAPTGPLPKAVNFPLARSRATASDEQDCLVAGDLQPYTRAEVGYAERGAIADLAARTDYGSCGALFIGDVVGDDLSLYPDVRRLTARLNGPVRFLPGNHDLDFDAADPEHAFDTFRQHLAPAYYSYDVGDVHVVALNTVRYPCTPDVDNADGRRPNCADPVGSPSYNGRLDDRQLQWLARDLARVPRDKLVLVAGHIPLLTFADEGSARHQVDQVREVYDLLAGRPAVSVAGHTHSIENMRTGDLFAGWKQLFGVEGLPFPHITAGAISGDWYSGRVTDDGYPLALGRDGGRPGVLTLEVDGSEFRERYTVTGESDSVQTQLALNTPAYRDWYAARQAWNRKPDGEAPAPPPADVVRSADLAGTTWLTTNFWMGSTGSTVAVSLDGGAPVEAVRTQEARGEGQRVGAQWSDPHAVREQLVHGGSVADRTMHLWRLELPRDLAPGRHVAVVTATDVHGREFTDEIAFEVR